MTYAVEQHHETARANARCRVLAQGSKAAEVLKLLLDLLVKQCRPELCQRALNVAAPQAASCTRVLQNRIFTLARKSLEHGRLLKLVYRLLLPSRAPRLKCR